jgi:hypothetical protein
MPDEPANATAMGGGATNVEVSAPETILGAQTPAETAPTVEGAKPPEGEVKPEDKPAEEAGKPETRAPEEYSEFTKPDGLEFDETALADYKAFAKEQDLTQEQAQKLLEFGGERIKAMTEAPYKAWSELQAKWTAEVKADPEVGGTNYDKSIAAAAAVFVPGEANPFVKTQEEAEGLKKAFDVTGAGNNPALVKFFVRLGGLLKEPGSLTGKPTVSGKRLEDKMYPTMGEQR